MCWIWWGNFNVINSGVSSPEHNYVLVHACFHAGHTHADTGSINTSAGPRTPTPLHGIMTYYKDTRWPRHVSINIPAHTQPHPCHTHTHPHTDLRHTVVIHHHLHTAVSATDNCSWAPAEQRHSSLWQHTYTHIHTLRESDTKRRRSWWCVKTTPSHHISHILYVFPA